jgi:chromosome segregation ATPase
VKRRIRELEEELSSLKPAYERAKIEAQSAEWRDRQEELLVKLRHLIFRFHEGDEGTKAAYLLGRCQEAVGTMQPPQAVIAEYEHKKQTLDKLLGIMRTQEKR